MNLDDIKQIQDETGIECPEFYVQVITNYPSKLENTDAPDFGLLDDPEVIIYENNDVRTQGCFGAAWPSHYFIIGQNGCGDYYVVDLDKKEFSVYFACHESLSFTLFASNLQEFISRYLSQS